MSVVALVRDAQQARSVITWAARFAAAQSSELTVFYWADPVAEEESLGAPEEEEFSDPTGDAVRKTVETVIRTRGARAGRVPRHLVTVTRISDPDPLSSTVRRIRIEDPQLFVAAETSDGVDPRQKQIMARLLGQIPCDRVVLYGGPERSIKATRVLVAATEGANDETAIALAASARTGKAVLTAMCVEARVGDEAIEIGERSLRAILRALGLKESSRLQVKAVLSDDPIAAFAKEADQHDLMLLGADVATSVPTLLTSTKKPLVGVLHRARQLRIWHGRDRSLPFIPRLNPADYADLYEKLQTGSRWNVDFMLMLGLAAAIATLGLLQNSPAVVIGSMLLAPLMTPMIGMGLALNQGNAKLTRNCLRSIGWGFLLALGISLVIGKLTPGTDLTPQVLARTEPNILDLLIALFSGMAAAYAMARPSLVGTVAGVAIATAIVPPLCSVGISLAYNQLTHAFGAASLLAANVLAIMLAAALTFRAMGLLAARRTEDRRLWVRQFVIGLAVCTLAIAAPLGFIFLQQVRRGKPQPIAFPVTTEVRSAVHNRILKEPGVELILIGRPGIPRDEDPIDVGIVISSEQPLSRDFARTLTKIVREEMGSEDVQVRVECVADGWEKTPQLPDATEP
jgi:uncharacterized hydrophobic protein (TIGR00271 family)